MMYLCTHLSQYFFYFFLLTSYKFTLTAAKVNIPRNTEQKLSDLLFQNYSSYGRPVLKLSSPINATFGIELMQLISVNERHQYIRTKLWVRQNWHNEQLRWDPSEFDGLDILHVNAKQVWKPDVVLYNNADDGFNGGTEKYRTLISIHANGTSVWLAPATFTSTCSMDVRYFPFDLQICKLKFGSWSYDVTKVQLDMDEKDLLSEKYINSSEWDIVKVNKKRNEIQYLCCPDAYHDVTFTFILRRRPLYFVFNVIAPCVVLVIMILFSFFLPPESGERISLTITVLLAFAVFLQVISASLPKNADSTPILSVFYMSVMAESALSLITTCIVLCIHHKGSEKGCQPLPMWVRRLFFRNIPKEIGFNHYNFRQPSDTVRELFSREFCMYKIIEKFNHNNTSLNNNNMNNSNNMHNNSNNTLNNTNNNNNNNNSNANNNNNSNIKKKCHCDTNSITKVNYSLNDILDELHKINDAILNQEKEDEIAEDWKIFGRIIDKIFFYMFLLTFLTSAAGTLLPVYLRKEY